MKRGLTIVILGWLVIASVACDSSSEPGDPVAGTITLGPDEGVDLFSGALKEPGHYGNSDLIASRNADGLKLSTGGDSPTHNRRVNWFKTGGGVPRTFASLDEVPTDRPTEGMNEPLIKAKTGNGFLVERADGGFTKGWVASAEGTLVTIEFAPAP